MKKVASFFLVIILILGWMPTMAFAETASEFAGGSGTQEDPFLIETKYHFDNVRNHLDAYFKMKNDIVFSDADFVEGGDFYNDGAGFLPFGEFSGTFDGNRYAVKNLQSWKVAEDYVALFQKNTGTIQRLGRVGGYLCGNTSVGGYTGGLVGLNTGTVVDCFNTGKVRGSDYAAAIVAKNEGLVQSCYNTGAVTVVGGMPVSDAGGIVCINEGTITDCYNSGIVTASMAGAGIVGYNYSIIENCYDVSGCGFAISNSGQLTNCYYNDGNNNYGENVAVKCTLEQMTKKKTFLGFDFENVWTFDKTLSSHPAPVLKNVKHIEALTQENTMEFAGGFGTCFSPFLISDKKHLNNVRNYLNSHFKMIEDIEFFNSDFAKGGAFYNNGAGFIPIGNDSEGFTGFFDGNRYAIKGLRINLEDQEAGLFSVNRGVIQNLGNVGGSVSGCEAGGVVGSNRSGSVVNCHNSAKIYASNCGGGIAGDNSMGSIDNCYNTADVFSGGYAGGISARNSYSSIRNCHNAGNVSGSYYAGGISGDSAGTIKNCYNVGSVSSSRSSSYSYAGGITGYSYSHIINCYNMGDVLGYHAGGVVGENAAEVKNCHNTGKVEGAFSAGGIVGTNCGGTSVGGCYNTGAVFDTQAYTEINPEACIGGIVGRNEERTHVYDCYNLGDITATHAYLVTGVGGIVGSNQGTLTSCYNVGKTMGFYSAGVAAFSYESDKISSCYYLDTAKQGVYDIDDLAVKCTNEQMKQQDAFIGFDFDKVWDINSTIQPYPILRDAHYHELGKYVYNNDATAKKDGTQTRTCKGCGYAQTVTAKGTKWKNPFDDVKEKDYYYNAVLWAVNNSITSGTGKTTFAPNEACTRGQIAAFLYRAAGSPKVKNAKNPFTDVKKSDYYYNAVLWAVSKGITSGTSKNTFSPNEACTRGQIATFLYRAAGSSKPKTSKNPFADVTKSDYYYKAVLWAVDKGITTGTSSTTFGPNESCTRGQIATFLYRYYN